jgi:hypothetical protein
MPADPRSYIVRFCHCSLFRVACKQRSADIYHHKFEKWRRNAAVNKQTSEHYYLGHATFPFTRDSSLRPAVVVTPLIGVTHGAPVVYSRFLAFWVNCWLLSSYCVAIPFLKVMMVTSAVRCLHATRKSEKMTCPALTHPTSHLEKDDLDKKMLCKCEFVQKNDRIF